MFGREFVLVSRWLVFVGAYIRDFTVLKITRTKHFYILCILKFSSIDAILFKLKLHGLLMGSMQNF